MTASDRNDFHVTTVYNVSICLVAMKQKLKLIVSFDVQSREVRSVIKTTGIWWTEPHGIDQSRTARFSTDRRRHLMSMLTMVGPSPDWCVGKWRHLTNANQLRQM